ncbi:MAG: twitching motility protein PilT [Anaerolineae bacterium]|nr:MAG: twitching motility protein PilT [Anaerolineae bacterium]
MDIVVDTSVIIAVIAHEAQRDSLIGLTRGANLLIPPSVHWEIGNAFSAMLKRKRITLAQALEAIRIYRRIPLRVVEVELEEALKIAAETGIYAYDAYLIRCAQKYRVSLLSLDTELIKVAEGMGVAVIRVETGR